MRSPYSAKVTATFTCQCGESTSTSIDLFTNSYLELPPMPPYESEWGQYWNPELQQIVWCCPKHELVATVKEKAKS